MVQSPARRRWHDPRTQGRSATDEVAAAEGQLDPKLRRLTAESADRAESPPERSPRTVVRLAGPATGGTLWAEAVAVVRRPCDNLELTRVPSIAREPQAHHHVV